MDYQYKDIEKKWQQFWAASQTFKADNNSDKPKYYVLDMFPYPSGAGLHVGHPLGYIASDIFSRYKRLKGFNVLHPMGYDSFGLPAEQYAIQTGQHPAITTEDNIATYRRQLDQLGFSFDWSREVRTSSPDYYKWTQWIFMQLFNSWYNKSIEKAESIEVLSAHFSAQGSAGINAVADEDILTFTADEWNAMPYEAQQTELLKYRLTYLRESTVNWCAALGTVLANDEVKDGFSERGGYPVEQKKMMQWSMRITAYAERLLQGLDNIDWPDPLKEMQRNWIGKSVGASVKFPIDITTHHSPLTNNQIEVFTTRVDTIFGVTFVVLAPEHELVSELTTPEQKATVEAYIAQTKKKSELDRMADTKTVSGAFTGSYVLNPLNGEKIQLWIADYVLAGYGTGAVMAVPSGDQRDYLFAKHFDLPIIAILDTQDTEKEADPTKEGKYINSDFVNGLGYKEATAEIITKLEEKGAGKAKVNFRMRDAIFGRQRYWGEPVPVYFKDGLPYLIDESELPLILPEIDKYLPTESGEPPLARAEGWKYSPNSLTPALSKGEGDKKTSNYGYETSDSDLWPILKGLARENRSFSTEAESLLWQHLRNSQTGYKIRRQHAIGSYIADLICLSKGLVIEVDGDYHQYTNEQDELRTIALNQLGFEVIRFSNEAVINNIAKVIQDIKTKLDSQPDRILNNTDPKTSLSFGEGRGEAFTGVIQDINTKLDSQPDRILNTTDPKTSLSFGKSGGESRDPNSLSFGEGRGEASYDYELSTMPGWAGSSWYWYRYMDAQNGTDFASQEAIAYWKDVDLYIGGSEHATGHLLYSRFWNKFLKDIGLAVEEEPFKKLINQGMIQGRSSFTYRLNPLIIGTDDSFAKPEVYVSKGVYELYKEGDFDTIEQIAAFYKELLPETAEIGEMDFSKLHVDVNIVHNDALDLAAFRTWRPENHKAIFILEDGSVIYPNDDAQHESKYVCDVEVEKMSKSKFNVVNPDDLIERYGADTLRMYEMFLGPLEQSKPWNTNGIEGVFKFLRKFWRLFHNEQWALTVTDAEPTKAEFKALHKIIRKVEEDIERFSFNTSVSSFMIAVNELTDLKCNKKAILQDLVIILSPYAPHICEELWVLLGNEAGTLSYAAYPNFVPAYLVEDDFAYPISINGKTRLNLNMALTMEPKEVEAFVLANADVQKYLDGKTPKKVIVVKGRIVNIVI